MPELADLLKWANEFAGPASLRERVEPEERAALVEAGNIAAATEALGPALKYWQTQKPPSWVEEDDDWRRVPFKIRETLSALSKDVRELGLTRPFSESDIDRLVAKRVPEKSGPQGPRDMYKEVVSKAAEHWGQYRHLYNAAGGFARSGKTDIDIAGLSPELRDMWNLFVKEQTPEKKLGPGQTFARGLYGVGNRLDMLGKSVVDGLAITTFGRDIMDPDYRAPQERWGAEEETRRIMAARQPAASAFGQMTEIVPAMGTGLPALAVSPHLGIMYWALMELPDLNKDLLDAGVRPEISMPLAAVGAYAIGAVEFLQVKGLTPSLRTQIRPIVAAGWRQALTEFGKRGTKFAGYAAGRWSVEVFEEAVQAVEHSATVNIGKKLEPLVKDPTMEKAITEALSQGWEAARTSAAPLGLLTAIGHMPHGLSAGVRTALATDVAPDIPPAMQSLRTQLAEMEKPTEQRLLLRTREGEQFEVRAPAEFTPEEIASKFKATQARIKEAKTKGVTAERAEVQEAGFKARAEEAREPTPDRTKAPGVAPYQFRPPPSLVAEPRVPVEAKATPPTKPRTAGEMAEQAERLGTLRAPEAGVTRIAPVEEAVRKAAPTVAEPAEMPQDIEALQEEARGQEESVETANRYLARTDLTPEQREAMEGLKTLAQAKAQAARAAMEGQQPTTLEEYKARGIKPKEPPAPARGRIAPMEEYGKANIIVSQEQYGKARERLAKRRGQVTVGIDPGSYRDLLTMGAYHFEAGVRKFAEWAEEVVKEAGETVRPHLKRLWNDLKGFRGYTETAESEYRRRAEEAVAGERVSKRIRGMVTWHRGEMVRLTPSALLRYSYRHEAKGARIGYRAGQLDLGARQQEIAAFAKEYLPAEEQGLIAKVLERSTRARTPAQFEKIIQAVNRMAQKHEQRAAVAEAKAVLKEAEKKVRRPELKQQLAALTEDLALNKPTERTLRRMQAIVDAAKVDKLGEIPQKLINRARHVLSLPSKRYIRDLAAEDLRGIANTAKAIIHAGEIKNRMLASAQYRNAQQAISDAITEIDSRHGHKFHPEPGVYRKPRKLREIVWMASWGQLSQETKAFILGGENSVTYRVLFEAMREGDRTTQQMVNEASDAMDAIHDRLGIDAATMSQWSESIGGKKAEPISVQLPTARTEDGTRVLSLEMTRAERMQILRHGMDSRTRAELLRDKAKGITFRARKGPAIKLRIGDLRAIEESATEQERAITRAMNAHINGPVLNQWNQVWVDEHGFELDTRPDYTPRRRDPEYLTHEPSEAIRFWTDRNLDDMGIFKPRTGSTAPIVIGDAYEEFYDHVSKVAAYTGRSMASKDALRLLRNGNFRNQLRDSFRYGDQLLRDMEDAVKDYRGMDVTPLTALDRTIRSMINKAHVGALALKLQTILYQTVSLTNASIELPAKYLFAPGNVLARSGPTEAEMRQHSPLLWARLNGSAHNILTPGTARASIGQFYGKKEQGFLRRIGMAGIHAGDQAVMNRIWRAAKADGRAQGLTGDALMEYTARKAERVVDRGQPSWDPLTISSLQRFGRKHPLAKLLVMFSSQRNKNLNTVVREISRFRHSDGTAADYAQLARGLAIPTILNATLIYTMQTATRAMFGYRPEESWADRVLSIVDRLLGNWLIFGDLASDGRRAITNALKGRSSIFTKAYSNILSGAIDDTLKAGQEIIKTVDELARDARYQGGPRKGDPKATVSALRAARHSARSLSVLLGLPLQAVEQIIWPWVDPQQKPTP